jgi:hypothetical protein
MSRLDERLQDIERERDPHRRRRMLEQAATGLLEAADRRQRRPAPKKPREPDDPPVVRGKWMPLADLGLLLKNK